MADAYRGLTIRIGGDTTKLTAALRAAQKAASQTQTQLRAIDKAAKFDPSSISNASIKIRLMEERAQDLASQLRTTREAYAQLGDTPIDSMNATVRQLSEQTDNAALSAQRALERYNAVDAELEQMYTAINKAARAAEGFNDKFDLRKTEDIEAAITMLEQLGIISQDDADKLRYLRNTWQDAFDGNEAAKQVQTFRELEVKAESLNSELKSTNTQLSQLKAPSNLSTSFTETASAVKRIDSQIKILEDDARKADEALKIDPTNMSAAARKMSDLAQAAELAQEKARLLGSEVEAYKAAGVDTLAKGMGEAASEAEKANQAYAEVSTQLTEAKANLEQLYSRQQLLSDSTRDTSTEYKQNAAAIEQAKTEVQQLEAAEREANAVRESANMASEYAQLSSELSEAKAKAEQLGAAMSSTDSKLESTLSYMKSIGMSLSGTVSPVMKQVGEYILTSASDIDSAYRDMRKTVNGSEGDFKKLKQAAIDFSNTNITSAEQILSIQAIGGELGVAVEDLQVFAETISNLDIATNLDTDTAAESLGHLANIMDDLNNSTMTGFSDALVRLGNNGASTETEIMEFATRIGSMASIVGMSTPDVLALASSIAATGQNSEAAGTAISNTMSDIESAAAAGGDSLEAFASVAQMSANEFASTWNENPTQAIKAFIEGLKQVEENGGSADAALQELGITGTRQKQAIMGLMQTIDGLNDNLQMSNDAWNGVSDEWGAAGDAANEAAAKNEGLSGSLQRISNIAQNAANSMGDTLAPVVSDLADLAAELGEAFAGTDDGFKLAVAGAGAFVAALGPGLTVTSSMFSGLSKLTSSLKAGKNAWSTMTSSVSAAAKVLGVAETSTEAVQLATEGLTVAQKMQATASSLASSAMLGLKGVAVGLALAGIGLLVTKYIEAQEHANLVKEATEDVSTALSEAEGSVGDLGDAFSDASGDSDEFLQSLVDLKDQTKDSFTEIYANNNLLDKYVDVISELGNKDLPLTASEQEKLATAVKGYNDITGASLEITDKSTGKLSENTTEVQKNAAAWKERAKAEGYSSAATEYYKKEAEASVKLSQAKETLAEKETALTSATSKYNAEYAKAQQSGNYQSESFLKAGAALVEAQTAYDSASQKVKEYSEAEKAAGDNAEYLSMQATILGSTLDSSLKETLTNLPTSLQSAGYDMATNLATGIEEGKISVDTACSFITSAADVISQLPSGKTELGTLMATNLAAGISAGNVSVEAALAVIRSGCQLNLSGLGEYGSTYGGELAQNLASAITNGSISATSAIEFMNAAASAKVAELPSLCKQYGVEMPLGMAEAIEQSASSVGAAASGLKDEALSKMDGLKDESQTKGNETAESLADGMEKKSERVKTAGKTLSDAAEDGIDTSGASDLGADFGQGFANGIGSKSDIVYKKAYALAKKAVAAVKAAQDSDSPAKETMDLGNDFGDGYYIGIQQRAKKAANAANYLASRALNALDVDSHVSTLATGTRTANAALGSIQATSSGQSASAAKLVKEMRSLRTALDNLSQPTYNINGITYDDGTSMAAAVKDLTRAIRVERRA